MRISKFDVQRLLAQHIGIVRGSLAEVPAAVHRMASGHFDDVARKLLAWRRQAEIGTAVQMMMDSTTGLSKQRASRIEKEAKTPRRTERSGRESRSRATRWSIFEPASGYNPPPTPTRTIAKEDVS